MIMWGFTALSTVIAIPVNYNHTGISLWFVVGVIGTLIFYSLITVAFSYFTLKIIDPRKVLAIIKDKKE